MSNVPTYEINYSFTFDGVKQRLGDLEAFASPLISSPEDPNQTKFEVKIKFGCYGDWDWLSCYVKSTDRDVLVKKATMRVSDVVANQAQSFCFEEKLIKKGSSWGHKLLEIRHVSYSDDTIHFHCNIRYGGDVDERKNENATFVSIRDPHLHDDLLKLFSEGEDADVTIHVREEKFKAHKVLLKARSDYFRALFKSGMEESRNNEVVVEEADPDLFKHFLEFLYTGAPPNTLSTVALGLLPLADRFGSPVLKDMCEKAVIANLSTTTTSALKILLFAHAHRCPLLQVKCLPIIRQNLESLIKTDDWKQLVKNHDLTVMVLESYAN